MTSTWMSCWCTRSMALRVRWRPCPPRASPHARTKLAQPRAHNRVVVHDTHIDHRIGFSRARASRRRRVRPIILICMSSTPPCDGPILQRLALVLASGGASRHWRCGHNEAGLPAFRNSGLAATGPQPGHAPSVQKLPHTMPTPKPACAAFHRSRAMSAIRPLTRSSRSNAAGRPG